MRCKQSFKDFKVHVLSTPIDIYESMHSLLQLVLARWLLVPWLVLLLPLIAFWPHFTLDKSIKALWKPDICCREREDSRDDETFWKNFETCWNLEILDREPSPGGLCYGPHGPTRWSSSHIGWGAYGVCMSGAGAQILCVDRQIEQIRTVVIRII